MNKIGNFQILINQNELKIIGINNDIIMSAELSNPDSMSIWVDSNFTKKFEFNSDELHFIIHNVLEKK